MPGVGAVQASFEDLGTSLFDTTFTVLDLETTGLSPTRDRITEVGAVKVRGGDVLGEFHCLVSPGQPIPPAVSALTGITDALVASCPPVEAALPSLLEFLAGTVVVAHNAHFDLAFLRAACSRGHYRPPDGTVVCTARLARRVLGREEVRSFRLDVLARHLRARVEPTHRALVDARATVDVLHGLLERAGSLGVRTLEDLRDYTRSTSDPAFRKVGLVDGAPDLPGVYRFLDAAGTVLYVGKATRLRERLRRYFGQDDRRRIADLVRATSRVVWQVAPTELEAAIREVRQIQRHKPHYNRRSKNPRRGVYVKLTREPFPRLSIVTTVRDGRALHVGPLPSRSAAQSFVDAVHDAIPLRQCTDRLTLSRGRAPCVLKEIGRCGAPCDGSQSPDAYSGVVAEYVQAVTEDPAVLLNRLRAQMERHARRRRYEDAARARRRLHTLARHLAGVRSLETLVRVEEVAAHRRLAESTEVVVVRHGRLAATAALPAGASEEEIAETAGRLAAAGPPATPSIPLGPDDLEEVALVSAWLEQDGVRAVAVKGVYASPVTGGAVLRDTEAEGRRVARAVRRDLALASGAKVAARAGAQATGAPTGVLSSTSRR